MVFVTIGTHDQEFIRLLKRLDKIQPKLKEKIIIQKGYSKYVPKNCESFKFEESLERYYKKARIVISHGGSSAWEMLRYKKPLIIVPRQAKFKEHINDHQVEFSQFLEEKTGVKVIYNINNLTAELLRNYEKTIKIDKENLRKLQNYLKEIIKNIEKETRF